MPFVPGIADPPGSSRCNEGSPAAERVWQGTIAGPWDGAIPLPIANPNPIEFKGWN
jgi:hypothetical protein